MEIKIVEPGSALFSGFFALNEDLLVLNDFFQKNTKRE